MIYRIEISTRYDYAIWRAFKQDNIIHRPKHPASESSKGHKSWWLNGDRHREDGPAIIYSNGHLEYYLNGKKYKEKDYYKIINKQ